MIKLYEWFEDDKAIYLVLEYCSGGELFDRLKAQQGDHFTEEEAARLVHMMVAACAYCHRMEVSHRDLKCVDAVVVVSRLPLEIVRREAISSHNNMQSCTLQVGKLYV